VCWVHMGVHMWTLYVTHMVNSALSIDSKKKLDDFFINLLLNFVAFYHDQHLLFDLQSQKT